MYTVNPLPIINTFNDHGGYTFSNTTRPHQILSDTGIGIKCTKEMN